MEGEMKRHAARAIALSTLIVSSCCQTLWLDVMRRESGPGAPLEPPVVASGPIPVPFALENRFLDPHPDDGQARDYTDRIDPRQDAGEVRAASLVALETIWRAHGAGTPGIDLPVDAAAHDAVLAPCKLELGVTTCDAIEVASLIPGALAEVPEIALVHYTLGGTGHDVAHAIRSCEGVITTTDVTQGAGVCGATARGTRLVLWNPLPEGASGLTVRIGTNVPLSRSLFTFIHLSDTQIRDPDLKLTDEVLSARLDPFIESFEHDEDQERYGPELAEALVATINADLAAHTDAADRARFVIHTGDSVDAGTHRELAQFHEIMDRLAIPWFNVLGNHDVLVFGNFLPQRPGNEKQCVSQVSIIRAKAGVPGWFVPGYMCVPPTIKGAVGPLDTYIAGADHATGRKSFIDAHQHRTRARAIADADGTRCDGLIRDDPDDGQHGFDLFMRDSSDPLPGYYAFAMNVDLEPPSDGAPRPRAIFIALNSEDLGPNEGGSMGRVGAGQLTWLGKILGCVRERDLVFLFAHHAPGEILTPGGASLRAHPHLAHPNITGYFYGHSHLHGLCREKGACTRFWEVESGSLIEHPQEGRLVRIKTVGKGLAFIETVVFTERLADPNSELARRVQLARRGAEHDRCLSPDFRCSDDERVRRADGRFTNARLFFRLPGSKPGS
jgi:hypothetical protein